MIWDKLLLHLRSDADIIKYEFYHEHNNDITNQFVYDVNDEPIPGRIFCCYCKVSDVKVHTGNGEVADTTNNDSSSSENFSCGQQ